MHEFISVLLSCFFCSQAINLFSRRHDEGAHGLLIGRQWYFYYNGSKYLFPDKYTIFAYGYNVYFSFGTTEYSVLKGPEINSAFNAAPRGEDVSTMWDNHANQALLTNISLVKDSYLIFDHYNTALLYRSFTNDWLISFHDKIVVVGPNSCPSMSANLQKFSNCFLQLEKNLTGLPTLQVQVVDPRLLGTRNNRYYVVSNRYRKDGRIIVIFAELYTDTSQSNTTSRIYMEDIVYVENFKHDEKNWTPFEWGNEIYFLSSIWPFTVVKVSVDAKKTWVGNGNIISTLDLDFVSCFRWPWSIGRHLVLRGGTQALMLSNTTYISIFHTFNNMTSLDNGALKTYVMGAFTFEAGPSNSSKEVQFRLTGISKDPISHNSWYEGPWMYQPNAYGMMDYVVFPMSVILENDNLYVIHGRNDKNTWITRLSLDEVLNSLVRVTSDGMCA